MNTLDTDLRLANAIAHLAIARATRLEAETALVYTSQLDDLPAELVEGACSRLAKLPREDFSAAMPTVGDIRAMARMVRQEEDQAQMARLQRALPPPDEANPATWVQCRHCEDAGWVIVTCPGGHARTCGRGSKGGFAPDLKGRSYSWGSCQAAHPFARRCGCEQARRSAS